MVLLPHCIVLVQNNSSIGIVFSILNLIIQRSFKCLYSQIHSNFTISKMQSRYRWFKNDLISKGYEFKSQTDTEVIAQLYDYLFDGDVLNTLIKTAKKLEDTLDGVKEKKGKEGGKKWSF